MQKKLAILTISIWDDQIRLSLIGKSLQTIGHQTFNLTVTNDEHGIRSVDPYEITYFIRSGIQLLTAENKITISSIGISVMPGYLVAWNKETCRPLSGCLLPNNTLSKSLFQEFKFSSFYSMFKEGHGTIIDGSPNVAINLWCLSRKIKSKKDEQLVISSIDTWINYFMTDCNEESFVASPSLVKELCFSQDDWDGPLLNVLGFNPNQFPIIKDKKVLMTKDFPPLDDGIPITYSTSTNELISSMMKLYTSQPVACVHLSNINHIYVQNLPIDGQDINQNYWLRFSSWKPLYDSFDLTEPIAQYPISIDDIKDDLAVPIDPFISFTNQRYHLLNMTSFSPKNIQKLGVLQTLFLIKYCLAQFDQKSQQRHIQKIIISATEWDPGVLQLLIDLCQVDGFDFKVQHWFDLVHICRFVSMNEFFSDSVQQQVFKVNCHFLPTLDPLTCYSLYQQWEDWFNKLYDYWH